MGTVRRAVSRRIQVPLLPANAGIPGDLGGDLRRQIRACAGMSGRQSDAPKLTSTLRPAGLGSPSWVRTSKTGRETIVPDLVARSRAGPSGQARGSVKERISRRKTLPLVERRLLSNYIRGAPLIPREQSLLCARPNDLEHFGAAFVSLVVPVPFRG